MSGQVARLGLARGRRSRTLPLAIGLAAALLALKFGAAGTVPVALLLAVVAGLATLTSP